MESQKHGDLQTCSVFLATDSLSLIPHELELRIGGMVYTAPIYPRKWVQNPVFHRTDLPPVSFSYHPPPIPRTEQPSPSAPQPLPLQLDPHWILGEDVIPVSLRALREILAGSCSPDLPPHIAGLLVGDNGRDARRPQEQHPQVPASEAVPRDADRLPLREVAPRSPPGTTPPPPPCEAAPQLTTSSPTRRATLDPTHLTPSESIRPALNLPIPNPHASPSNPWPTQPAPVTETFPQGATTLCSPQQLPDLALQVCHNTKDFNPSESNRPLWDPHLLFPELGSSPNPRNKVLLMNTRTNPNKAPAAAQNDPTLPLHRTTKGRINKKTNQSGLEKLDVQAFIDVPLQRAEGEQLLQSIGASGVSIPPNHVGPTEINSQTAQQQQHEPILLSGPKRRGRPRSTSKAGPPPPVTQPPSTNPSSQHQQDGPSPQTACVPLSSVTVPEHPAPLLQELMTGSGTNQSSPQQLTIDPDSTPAANLADL